MVVQKSQGWQDVEAHSSTAKSFFGRAFSSSMTVYPLKLDDIPSGYASPVMYTAMLASANTAIALAVMVMRGKASWDVRSVLLWYFWGAMIWLLYFLVATFLSSYIGAKIVGIEHNSKQFGLIVSSLTYLCVLNVLGITNIDILVYIARLAGSLLMSYYLRESYQESITYQSARTNTIHAVWIFVCCMLFPYINDITFQLIAMYKSGY